MGTSTPTTAQESGASRSRRERLQAFVDSSPDAFFLHDLDGAILDVNQQACATLGYSRDELLHTSVGDIEQAITLEWLCATWRSMRPGAQRVFTGLHRRKDGSVFPVEVNHRRIDANERPLMLALARDTSDRRRFDRLLQLRLATLRRINGQHDVSEVMRTLLRTAMRLCGATGGTWGLFQEQRMVFREYCRDGTVTPVDYRFTAGRSVPGRVMETLRSYVSNDAAHDPNVVQKVRKELGIDSLVQVPLLDRSGVLLGCLELHNKRLAGGFDGRDVEWLESLAADGMVALENARLVQHLNRQHDALEQTVAERDAELGNLREEVRVFTHSIAHDLRVPLRGIRRYNDLCLAENADRLDAHGLACLYHVQGASRQMDEVIQALLQFSEVSRATPVHEPVDLSLTAHGILEALRGRDPERHVNCVIAPGMTVLGDPALLRLALDRLLHNAWTFTRTNHDARIEFGATREGEETVYYLRDNGVGFDRLRPHLRTDQDFAGTGIGLAIARRIIQRHNGKTWAETAAGKGTTFYFTLP